MAGLDAWRRCRPFGPLGIEIGKIPNVVGTPGIPSLAEVLDDFFVGYGALKGF